MIQEYPISLLIAAAVPPFILTYLMICRLNARKWSPNTPEPWAYLFMGGGAIWTIYSIASMQAFPTLGKLLMDAGACAYFGWNSWRIGVVRRRKRNRIKQEKENASVSGRV